MVSLVPLMLVGICLVSGRINVTAPKYVVNLDEPPLQRWSHVIADYASLYPALMKVMYSHVPKQLVDMVTKITEKLDDYIPPPYADEIRGIAMAANVTTGETLMGNMMYDFTAFQRRKKDMKGACTSILAVDANGTVYHGRNLDYTFGDILRNFTITVEFRRSDGHLVFTGTTFAGLVGIITGVRPNGISITLNQRNSGHWWENVMMALKTRLKGFVSFVLRDVLANESMSYKMALAHLSQTPMIAPCYIILGGVKPMEAAVITRDRLKARDVWIMQPGQWYLVETNYNHWEPVPSSDDRRGPATAALVRVGQPGISAKTLYRILSIPPILNNKTSYTVVMSAGKPDVYRAVIRYP